MRPLFVIGAVLLAIVIVDRLHSSAGPPSIRNKWAGYTGPRNADGSPRMMGA